MHENLKLTIAIDGPSGSGGKSSVSKEVARHLAWRTWTPVQCTVPQLNVLELGIDLNDAEQSAKAVEEMPPVFGI